MEKVDLRKALKHLYNPKPGKPELIEVPSLSYAMVDGHGDPNTSSEFQEAIEALYGVSFTAKFTLKKADPPVDYSVMGLEGLFWTADLSTFSMERRGEWDWTLMIMQPKFVTREVFLETVERLSVKRPSPALNKLRLETLNEGLSVQVMHIGPYAEEPTTIGALHAFIRANGYEFSGRHHEVYLSDPRKAKPETMKTIIRQPVTAAAHRCAATDTSSCRSGRPS